MIAYGYQSVLSNDCLRLSISGHRWIRTTEGENQQIYSLPHLATLEYARLLILFNCNDLQL